MGERDEYYKLYMREYRKTHRESVRKWQKTANERRSVGVKRSRDENMEWARNSKKNRCFHCHLKYDGTFRFVFHHVFEQYKLGKVSVFADSTGSMELIKRFKNEVKKCMFLCINCHNKHHKGLIQLDTYKWQEAQWPRFLLYDDFGVEKEVA